MDYLFLPYLQSDAPLDYALRRMRRTDSRAVVVERAPDAKSIYMNKAVVEAWSAGKSNCSELPDAEAIPLLDLGATAPPNVPWPPPPFYPLGSWDALRSFFEQQLAAMQMAYGILLPRPGESRPMALVISQHEGDTDKILHAQKYCRCTYNKKHIEASPPAADAADCDWCSGTYECY